MPIPERNAPAWGVQWWDLWRIELTNWRWSWRTMLTTATLAPLASTVALGVFARDAGAATLAYVLTGNAVLSLMFGNMHNIAGHFVYIRFMGMLDYFATLPVRRGLLILAVVSSFFMLALPSVAVTIGVGAALLRLSLHPSPWLALAIPLCALPLAGVGALIGLVVRTPGESGSFSLIVTLLLTALGPVVIPPDRLPGWMLWLGHLSPTTYAASALRQALLGPVTGRLAVDLAALAGFAGVVFYLVGRRMDWRGR